MELELRAAMLKKGYTARTLAEEIGISTSSLVNKYKGRTEFTKSELEKIQKCLNLSEAEFLRIFFN